MKDAMMRDAKHGSLLLKVFLLLIIFNILVEVIIYLVTVLTLTYSDSVFDIFDNSVTIVYLMSLNSMASKVFIMELASYHNKIYNRTDYLQISMPADEFYPINFYQQFYLFWGLLNQALVFLFQDQILKKMIVNHSIKEIWTYYILT